MKKIIYLCLLALLAMSLGCSKAEIYNEDQSENNELADDIEKDIYSKESSSSKEQYNNAKNSSGSLGIYDEYGIPYGTDLLAIYLDMSYIQLNYNGSYTGSFNEHYKNEMSAHFTIYAAEEANWTCGNIVRWLVHKQEYYAYTGGGSTDTGIIVLDVNSGSSNSSTGTGGTGGNNDEGWTDENGNPVKPTKKPVPTTVPQQNIPVPDQYQGCF